MSIVKAKDLQFSYPVSRQAKTVFSLTLERLTIEKGERVLVVGPSGCGKSTLLNLIAGELVPTHGSLHVSGLELSTASDALRRSHRIQNMGFVFQDFPLVSYLNVIENVLLPYRINPTLVLNGSINNVVSLCWNNSD